MAEQSANSIRYLKMLLKHAVFLLFALALCHPLSAMAETAVDITAGCAYASSGNGNMIKFLFDDRYKTDFYVSESKKSYLQITAPEGQTIGGIYIKWYMYTSAWRVDVFRGEQWETVTSSAGEYLAEYLALPAEVTTCRVCPAIGERSALHMSELRVFGSGAPPPDVQMWEPIAGKCDILVISAHPDDEYIFMGGTIPYYHANGKTVEVLYLASSASYRKLELLDGLWLCGIRNYPILGVMRNVYSESLCQLYKSWSRDRLYRFIVRGIRQCKPDVVVTHDIHGEYGHAAHKAAADAAIRAMSSTADPKQYPDSAEQYGIWQVSKLYLHLYGENCIVMDWRTPLNCYQGETALSIAAKAFEKHRSQQCTEYEVLDSGKYDNRLFGLYFSLVGEDVEKNDFLENLPSCLAAPDAVDEN